MSNFRMSRTLKRIAVTMMTNPYRTWTQSSLARAAGCPVGNYVFQFRKHHLTQRSVVNGYSAFTLTQKGRKELGEVIDHLAAISMTEAQQVRAQTLAREIVGALPEEMADRMVLARNGVIHVITDEGDAYALTIAPR